MGPLPGGAAALGAAAALPFGPAWASLTAAKSPFSTDEPQTPLKDVTTYNNFYEFGTDKDDPAKNAHTLTTTPWKIKADGLIDKPAEYDLDDLIKAVHHDDAEITRFDTSCFSGEYVTGDVSPEYLSQLEQQRNDRAKSQRDARNRRASPHADVAVCVSSS